MFMSHAQNSSPSLACETFSQTTGTFMVYWCSCSFHLCYFGSLFTIKFALYIFKTKFSGEICLPYMYIIIQSVIPKKHCILKCCKCYLPCNISQSEVQVACQISVRYGWAILFGQTSVARKLSHSRIQSSTQLHRSLTSSIEGITS